MNQRIHTEPVTDEAKSKIVYFDELDLDSYDNKHIATQWQEPERFAFTRAQKQNTTILFGGLTHLHDRFLEAGLQSLGYRAQALNCPDKQSLQTGKEFGNRGQCNPTYFTVGNLVKYLIDLRDNQGMPGDDDGCPAFGDYDEMLERHGEPDHVFPQPGDAFTRPSICIRAHPKSMGSE